jgi:DNA-binding NtrC family response regulator
MHMATASIAARKPFRVLLIDDEEQIGKLLNEGLQSPGVEFFSAPDASTGYERACALRPNLILLDLGLPDADGMELLDRLLTENPNQEIVVFTGLYSHEKAVRAIRRGASDYLTKPLPVGQLVKQVHKMARLEERVTSSSQPRDRAAAFREGEELIGRSPELLDILAKIDRIGPNFRTALICGETGTGKDLAARALHRSSKASGPLVVCNCAAIVESLFESELFGYQKGAFTGALQDKVGLVEHASGGALFLDEVGELPLTTQAKLLRVLQTREVQRVGSTISRKIDVRIIAATNRDLRQMVEQKTFREDLYFRLALIQLEMPPLSHRIEDLPLLENHFLHKFAVLYRTPSQRLSRRVQMIFSKHSWPGNIRELENVIAYCCMISQGDVIEAADLPDYLRNPKVVAGLAEESELNPISMRRMRLEYVARVLERVGGNRSHAARILQVGRGTLLRYIKDAGIQ